MVIGEKMGQWTYWRKCRKLISTCRFWLNIEWIHKRREYYRRWSKANSQSRRLSYQRWNAKNPEYQSKWYQNHKEQKKVAQKKWNLNHREFWNERMAKKRGVLKTEVYLNSRFSGSVLHHMGWINGKMTSAYIPENLHKSISHSLTRDKNMTKINSVVRKWLDMGGMVA